MNKLIAGVIFSGCTILRGCGGEEVPNPDSLIFSEAELLNETIPNLEPPTQLDILMSRYDDFQTGLSTEQRCAAWGGQFKVRQGTPYCLDLDY
jgi:hypothetical protein